MQDSQEILPRYVGEQQLLDFIRGMTPAAVDVSVPVLEQCRLDDVPVLSPETRTLLAALMTMKKPKRVLEIGTAYGFSSIFMSRFLADGGMIDTIERNPVMLEKARFYLKETGLGGKTIFLHEGQAQEILPGLNGPYDLVLMDASMGQYLLFWEEIQNKISEEGWVLADNVLHGGLAALERLDIPRRQRTIHTRLRAYLEAVLNDARYQSSLLPIGDGILISVRKGKEHG